MTDKWDQFTDIDGVLYEPENNNTWIKPTVFHIYLDQERANVYANHRPASKAEGITKDNLPAVLSELEDKLNKKKKPVQVKQTYRLFSDQEA